jgi:hypothetical protein
MPSSVHNSANSFAGEQPPQNSWSDSWSNNLGLDHIATLLDESHEQVVEKNALEEQSLGGVPHDIITSSLTWPALASDCQSPRDTDTPPRQQQQFHGEADDTLTDINELTGLNSRIYQLEVQVGTASLSPHLCDDLTASTRSLLTILEGAVDSSRRNHCQVDHQALPSTYLPAYPSPSEMLPSYQAKGQDARFRRQTIDSSIYPDEDYGPVRGVADTSTLFLILACYQRLFSLFKHVCISIHMQLEDNAELQSSTAQIVMTTELMSHLLGRLDRGLQQLFPTGPPTPASSAVFPFSRDSTLTPPSMFDVATNVSGIWSLAKSRSAIACEDLFSNGASGDAHSIMTTGMAHGTSHSIWSQGVSSVMHTMLQRQKALKTHICILKHLVQESNKF